MIKEIQKLRDCKKRIDLLGYHKELIMFVESLAFFSPALFIVWLYGFPFWYSVLSLALFSGLLTFVFYKPLIFTEKYILGLDLIEEKYRHEKKYEDLFNKLSLNLKTNIYIESLVSTTINSLGVTLYNNSKLQNGEELNKKLLEEAYEILNSASEKLYDRIDAGECSENLEQLKNSL